MACQPLLMCHRLPHLDGPSLWLVTLCPCATGCTTWMGPVGGLSPSAHVPQVVPPGGPPLTPDPVECYFPVSTLKLAAIQPLNDCVVFAK